MKIRHTTNALLPVLLLVIFASCKKEAPSILDMFRVKLTFNQSQPYAVDENGEIDLNATDSVLIDYTLESPDEDMFMICLYKTGSNAPAQKIPVTDNGKRRTYSGTFKFLAKDLGAGLTSYRIWPLDKNGVYLGDGYKRVTINVFSDIKYFANRKLFLPDSAEKVNPCYLSINEGNTYSYSTGATNAGNIDLGFYRKWELVNNVVTERIHMYSLSANPLPFVAYDISSWSKRGTLFSAPVTSNASASTFRTRFSTGPKIVAEAKAVNINLLSSATPLAANQFIFFKTPEGKYGVLFIQAFSYDYDFRRYILLSYRMQE
jgi:hypothetical protein